jgi:hypothetical protein
VIAAVLFDGGLGSFRVVVLIVAMVLEQSSCYRSWCTVYDFVDWSVVMEVVSLVGANVDSSLIRSHRRLVGRLDV